MDYGSSSDRERHPLLGARADCTGGAPRNALSRHGRETDPSVAASLTHFAFAFAGQLTAGTNCWFPCVVKLGPRCRGAHHLFRDASDSGQ